MIKQFQRLHFLNEPWANIDARNHTERRVSESLLLDAWHAGYLLVDKPEIKWTEDHWPGTYRCEAMAYGRQINA